MVQPLQKILQHFFFLIKYMPTICFSYSTLRYLPKKKRKAYIQMKTCIRIFTVGLFIISKN